MRGSDRITPPAVRELRQTVNSEGHKLTWRKLASEAEAMSPVFAIAKRGTWVGRSADSQDRNVLLKQAADQLLRTKKSKALGHPNGERGKPAPKNVKKATKKVVR
jgi:hypothetical protein